MISLRKTNWKRPSCRAFSSNFFFLFFSNLKEIFTLIWVLRTKRCYLSNDTKRNEIKITTRNQFIEKSSVQFINFSQIKNNNNNNNVLVISKSFFFFSFIKWFKLLKNFLQHATNQILFLLLFHFSSVFIVK